MWGFGFGIMFFVLTKKKKLNCDNYLSTTLSILMEILMEDIDDKNQHCEIAANDCKGIYFLSSFHVGDERHNPHSSCAQTYSVVQFKLI